MNPVFAATDTPLPVPTALLEVRIGKVQRLGGTEIMTRIVAPRRATIRPIGDVT